MQQKVQRLVLDDDTDDSPRKRMNSEGVVDDEGYFNTYSHFAIHHEMLTVKFLYMKNLSKINKLITFCVVYFCYTGYSENYELS